MAGKHTIIKKCLCILTALTAAAAITMPDAMAFDEKENKAQQSQLQKEAEKKQNELAKTEMSLQEKISYSEELQGKISDLSQKIQQSNKKINDLNKKIKDNQVLIDEKTAQIDDKLELLKERLRAIYTAGDISSLEIILQAKDFSDYVDKMELVSSITDADNKLIKNLQDKMSAITKEQEELKEAKTKVENEKKQLEKDKAKLNELSSENQIIINELMQKQYNKENEIQENENRQRELEQALERYNAQKAADAEKKKNEASSSSNKASSVEKKESSRSNPTGSKTETPKQNSNQSSDNENSDNYNNNDNDETSDYYEEDPAVPVSDGKYVWPLPGHTYLTSTFDEWRGADNHGALDIADGNVYGAKVIACAGGTVFSTCTTCTHDYGKFESCGCGGGYGNYVMIDHGNGKISIYGHLSNVVVEPGQYVSAGQYIGNVGSTGYSTGPHLHFETRRDGVRYDPLSEY